MSNKTSPVRKQYLDIKRRHPEAIVFFRLGDFYETFDGDAEITARVLDIVLTSRTVGNNTRVPMAGIPHHAAENYISRLIDAGYHVAICEQVGDEPVKGLFPREVVRVITPGTVLEQGLLPGDANNYLASVLVEGNAMAVAYTDVSTGEFAAMQLVTETPGEVIAHEIERLRPAEVLIPEEMELPDGIECHQTSLPRWHFEWSRAETALKEHFGTLTLDGFGMANQALAVQAAGAIIEYLSRTQPAVLPLLNRLSTYSIEEFMILDRATRRNLELTETIRGGSTKGSLLGVLDQTITPMGRRLLRQWLNKPLLDADQINQRLDRVEAFFDDGMWRSEVRAALKPIGDLERLTNRVLVGVATPADLTALRALLEKLGPLHAAASRAEQSALTQILEKLDSCEDVLTLLHQAIQDEPPATLGNTGIIRSGYSAELDKVIEESREAREWISNLEALERKRTGIKSLKVGYNKVFGYYIEVTKANSDQVPEDYIRKQTLVGAERYITPEMKDVESRVLSAEEEIKEIETRVFREVCMQVSSEAVRLLTSAQQIALLDTATGLAETAAVRGYNRPELLDDATLDIREGRHPVVEDFIPGRRFVSNDTHFEEDERIRIITGPNMSGKSTYLRQVALIVLMAQMGSYVPARLARLGITDRIFTRIGAQDEIHAGQSTFMVEMVEAANILNHASSSSLLILDEIGRGTSTYDGLSIAWAIVEYIHSYPQLRSRTLFATHYHELTTLAQRFPGVRNYNVAVSEEGGEVVFLHTIIPGKADKSYGIHVAELAGLPRPVINRAQEILSRLEAESRSNEVEDSLAPRQLAFFPKTNPLVDELRGLNVETLTPLEALNKIYEWQRRFGTGED
ncbi:MAG: DNA mismatch repair protein MutS [Anaerolineales bacterium]|nr:DNA mismatch repair protein MutS [Anaerolineales bacterium]